MKRTRIDRCIGCVLILCLSLHFVSAALTRWWWSDVCVIWYFAWFFLFCNNCIFCRSLHRSMILSGGSTLRSSLKTRNRCRTVAVGGRGQGDNREETRRGGYKKGAQERGGKEACCCVQREEGEEAWTCTPSESNDRGESRLGFIGAIWFQKSNVDVNGREQHRRKWKGSAAAT